MDRNLIDNKFFRLTCLQVEEPKNVINQTVIRSLDMQRARYFEVVGWIHPYFTCLFF
ncbi:unnamed protein product [Prunus armeniaca]|uniref:Uncharacterized protein n=1 Tax=Prunus armeniaca TaxID=36596 RepID=A0A6J5V2P9_PRUAR|nr:unnamed protein product [Prunus armeniaca]